MEIGKLNQRIVILENKTMVDAIGNHTAQWEEAFTCWACISVKNSTETDNAGVTKEVQTLEFLIRQTPYTANLSTSANRIQFRGNVYDFSGIVPNFKSQDYMKIIAVVRKAGV